MIKQIGFALSIFNFYIHPICMANSTKEAKTHCKYIRLYVGSITSHVVSGYEIHVISV